MEKIASFTVNHLKLIPGVYVSRRDTAGDTRVTTFDLRMTRPNPEPVMNTAEIHTIEHLGATFLSNHRVYKDRVLYFGPMGCRTASTLTISSFSGTPPAATTARWGSVRPTLSTPDGPP